MDDRPVLKARVAAPPVDGAANAALVRLLAKATDGAPSAVEVTAGGGERLKRLRVAGDPHLLAERLSSGL